MDNQTLNKLQARLIFRKNLATRERIQACLRDVTSEMGLAEVMVAYGYLSPVHYDKLQQYIDRLQQTDEGRAKLQALLSDAPREEPPKPAPPSVKPAPEEPMITHVKSRDTTPPADDDGKAGDPYAFEAVEEEEYFEDDSGEDLTLRLPIVEPDKRPEPATKPLAPVLGTTCDDDPLPVSFKGRTGEGTLRFPIPRSLENFRYFDEILAFSRRAGASDVHMAPNATIMLRHLGRLVQVTETKLTPDKIQQAVTQVLSPEQHAHLVKFGDLELGYGFPGGGRYRISIIRAMSGLSVSARIVPLSMDMELGVPESCRMLTDPGQGLVLITGPRGCGKSTTLAGMVQRINQERREHIITLEHPIEYVYRDAKSLVTQREIGTHAISLSHALEAALHEDPDVMVISELKSREIISLALSAAERGQLVFAMMNTPNATQTITHLIDSFPKDERKRVRTRISENLRGVVSQRLIPRVSGKAMVAGFEVLIMNDTHAEQIRDNQLDQIAMTMQLERGSGSQRLDDDLKFLVEQRVITGEVALSAAMDPHNFAEYSPDFAHGGGNGVPLT